MFYQEKVINGVLMFRSTPKGEWKPATGHKITMEEYLKNIDFPLLKEQKMGLLTAMKSIEDGPVMDCLDGILNMIDSLQDIAVDQYGMDENEVFQFNEE